jgi:hypothetical protein
MDTDKLRKLASLLRHEANRVNSTKQQKLANITLASASLELLRRKIYG